MPANQIKSKIQDIHFNDDNDDYQNLLSALMLILPWIWTLTDRCRTSEKQAKLDSMIELFFFLDN